MIEYQFVCNTYQSVVFLLLYLLEMIHFYNEATIETGKHSMRFIAGFLFVYQGFKQKRSDKLCIQKLFFCYKTLFTTV